MPDYIPNKEPAKIQWLWNLALWLWRDNALNGLLHGFSIHEVNIFRVTVVQAKQAADNNVTKQAAARAATVAKNTAFGAAIAMARDNAQRLQNDPNMTDEDRAAAGLSVPDAIPTSTALDEVMMLEPPLLLLKFNIRRQVTVHWGPNPNDESHNARPAGTIGCQIQVARGGIPTEEAQWIALDVDTDSPLLHVVDDTTPTTYAYRARYVGKNVKFGPFGDPAVCTVSV